MRATLSLDLAELHVLESALQELGVRLSGEQEVRVGPLLRSLRARVTQGIDYLERREHEAASQRSR